MDWIREFVSRCRGLWGTAKRDEELEEELQSHIDLALDANLRRGMTYEEARSAALCAFGGLTQTREAYRMRRGFTQIRVLSQDLHYAWRQWRRAPGFAVFAFLVLALGIGIATAMFAVSYAVLLKPLPFPNDRELFEPVEKTADHTEVLSAPYAELQQWETATKSTAQLAYSTVGLDVVDGPQGAALVSVVQASRHLLPLLRAVPMIGRSFLPDEQDNANAHVVLLSYKLWRENFSSDRNVVGKTVHIGAAPYTVIGVMPEYFEYPMWNIGPEIWVPLGLEQQAGFAYGPKGIFQPIVRVDTGRSVEDVEAQLDRIHKETMHPTETEQIHLTGLHDLVVGGARPVLRGLEIAVALVWLIACANVAGLLLARVAARRPEIAMRAALGASRERICVQLLTESLLLSCAGAVGGLALAILMLQFVRQVLVKILPVSQGIHLSWPVWASLVTITVLTTLAFGVSPAFTAARTGVDAAIKNAGHSQTHVRGQSRLRSVLIAGEVALSLALLISAVLMIRSIYALHQVPLGFRTDHVVLTSLTIPSDAYQNRDVKSLVWQPLLDALRGTPGIQSAAMSTVMRASSEGWHEQWVKVPPG